MYCCAWHLEVPVRSQFTSLLLEDSWFLYCDFELPVFWLLKEKAAEERNKEKEQHGKFETERVDFSMGIAFCIRNGRVCSVDF